MIMMNRPGSENKRLSVLQQYQIMDTEAEKSFDELVQLTADICAVPLAAISLLDAERQWFKAKTGILIEETAIEDSFCQHTIRQDELLVVEDVLQDERFRNNPLVTGDPHVRFYAGMPLISPGNVMIGTLCVLDTVPRELNRQQKSALEILARQAMNLLELRHKNRLLEEASREAQEALRAKSEFLSVMSHELRTPLNGIIGLTHWLLQDNPYPQQIELMNTLKFSAESLLTLINDILDYNKLQAHKLQLEKMPFSLSESLEQTIRPLTFLAVQKELVLEFSIPPELPLLAGDPHRLTQILNNLLGNALKFTQAGRISLMVAPVMETENFMTLRFTVKDTGIGIPADKLETIFQEFSQVSPEISRKYGGTGLGLTITRKLLQLMGSDLRVNSTPGEGTEFMFSIAFQKSTQQQPGASHFPGAAIEETFNVFLNNKKVLLAEDNQVNQLITAKFLKSWGLETHIANNGLEALQMVQCEQYDLILMDLQMPEMDGFEASRQLRRMNAHYRQLPIIALTASAVGQYREEAGAAGITSILTKPFKPDQLYNAICQYLKAGTSNSSLLLRKVEQVSDGDFSFRKELIHLYLKSFRDILGELNAGKLQDPESLRRTRHKHKSTLHMLELDDFESALLNLEQVVESGAMDQADIHGNIRQINQLGEQLIQELEAIM